jgi:hypothetical protein
MELEDVSFQFLQEITDGFSEKRILGEGAFGVVYKVRFGMFDFYKEIYSQ